MASVLVRDTIRDLVAAGILKAQQAGALQLETVPEILIERPGHPEHGDFATSLPLRLARATRINPLQLAEILAEHIPAAGEVDRSSLSVLTPPVRCTWATLGEQYWAARWRIRWTPPVLT